MSSVAVAINLEEIPANAIQTRVAQDLGEPTRGSHWGKFELHLPLIIENH